MSEAKSTKKYFEAVGRRKESSARVRITPSAKTSYSINEKPLNEYCTVDYLIKNIEDALNNSGVKEKFSVSVRVSGGGITSQSEAIRLGIARAIIKFMPETRATLKKLGFLKRDARVKERRKFGLKKARKAPQWSKR
jgi:small subunit ribosomal protein S9